MQAVMYDKFGDASVLSVRETLAPQPASDQVQVHVRMAGLNPLDWKLRSGILRKLGQPRRPAITGKDFVGEITMLGRNVRGYSLNQRVFGSIESLSRQGSCAQFIAVPVNRIALVPETLRDEVAASLPVASGTALQVLADIADLQAGQSLLIIGAAGAVGASAVQIGLSIGARITAVCSGRNMDYVRSLGAERIIDYQVDDWRQVDEKFDVIFDAAASASFSQAKPHLAMDGVYINTHPSPALYWAGLVARATSRRRCVPFMVMISPALLERLARLAVQDIIRPRIHEIVGLHQVGVAQHHMQEGKIFGKICVRVDA